MSKQHKTEVEILCAPVAVVVDYEWQPYEPPTLEYPGADAEVTINQITTENGSVLNLPTATVESVRQEILEHELTRKRDADDVAADHAYDTAREDSFFRRN